MATDTPAASPVGTVIPLGQARSRVLSDERRHDNPHWPVRSPIDAANALLLHSECPGHCTTKVAALLVSRNNYQYFRDRGRIQGGQWTPQSL